MAEYPLQSLCEKYLTGILTEPEFEALKEFRDDPRLQDLVDGLLLKTYHEYLSMPAVVSVELSAQDQAMLERILAYKTPVIPMQSATHRSGYKYRWIAAAVIALLLTGGGYWWLKQEKGEPAIVQDIPAKQDVLPGKNGATLTLSDGRQVVLDSLGNGIIAQQQGSDVNLQNGKVVYDPVVHDGAGTGDAEVVYNTMTTPRGVSFSWTLPDGTQVWLNAESSITYPTVFAGRERTVKVTGELYFEVAKDQKKTFTVQINESARVDVLGTEFNVNAYANEPAVRATLVQGSVKVSQGATQEILQPGAGCHWRAGQDRENI